MSKITPPASSLIACLGRKGDSWNERLDRYPALRAVSSQPPGQQWVYQLARAFQLSPTEIGLLVNIRWCAIRPVDIEVGNDLVIVDRVDRIEPKAIVPLNRGDIGKHPRTGEPLLLSRYPLAGGFVPLGACRSDGSPHPHAGTGFAMSHVIGYPVDAAGQVTVYGLWDVPVADRYFRIELQQYRYDGMRFTVEHTEVLAPDALLPAWEFTSMPLGNCLPDGDDLLGGLVGKPAGNHEAPGSGLARWQRRDGHWQLAAFTPVTGPDGAFEPSLVRDADGSLLLSARGGARIEGEGGEEVSLMSTENDIRVWRSMDGGATWALILHARGVRAGTPVTINQAVDGTVYIAGNPYRETDTRGQSQPSIEMRETLCLWPLAADRRSLLDPVVARDCSADFGVPPYGSIWRADHPVGMNVRLADGHWHHLLAYRVLEQNECVSDAPATACTGTYLEEIVTSESTQE
jgi:hypothetical protein